MRTLLLGSLALASILRDADPTGAGTGGSDPSSAPIAPDFLQEDLSAVDTSIPMIVEGLYDLEVAKIECLPNKAGTGQVLKFTLKTTAEAKTTRGDTVQKGFPLFHTISITPTPDYSPDAIKRACAGFVQAMGGQRIFPVDQYESKVVRAKIIVGKETEKNGVTYAPSNKVKQFVKPE